MGFKNNKLNKCFNVRDIAKLAQKNLPKPVWDYLEGGADDEISMHRNQDAFCDFQLLPKTMVDVSQIDLSTKVLGQTIKAPVILSPTGMSRLFHDGGETSVANAANKHGLTYCLSTLASTKIEDIGKIGDMPKCLQIYVLQDRGMTIEIVNRAKEAGFTSLCLAVDSPIGGNRERSFRSGLSIPPRLTPKSLFEIAQHPYWITYHLLRPMKFANIEQYLQNMNNSEMVGYFSRQFAKDLLPKDIDWLANIWGAPIAIKGIVRAEDAIISHEHGASAIMISNHGGRQLDKTPAPIEVLQEIVAKAPKELEIILDGGVRRATDIIIALSLGARACMIGRPYLYGLAAAGMDGVDKVLQHFMTELHRNMMLMGAQKIEDLNPSFIQKK